MGNSQDFPFGIMDVAELLHLRIRRRQANGVYVDCPFCGDKRGKMSLNSAINAWRCNYCGEHGGMLALYARVYQISNSDAYREICEELQTGMSAPDYVVPQRQEVPEAKQSALASIQEIHQTLSMLLGMLTLSEKHRKHLREKRGLSDEQIDGLGYKSTPPFYLCRSLTERLIGQGCKVAGVPGFYLGKDDKWTVNFNTITAGIIIPARGIDRMVRGAQIRLDIPIKDKDAPPDKDGTKYLWLASSNKNLGVTSGSPIHFVGDPFARAIYVTEGLLKADIAHHLMDRSFIAIAGANNVSKLEPLFALLAQNGTELIVEAQDMDKYRNEMVDKGASKVYLMARQNGLECRRLTWDPNYKGIDDWQLALRKKQMEKENRKTNFKDRYLCGLCDFGELSDCIAAWHEKPEDGVGLIQYLGLTEQEYGAWLRDGNDVSLRAALDTQRDQQRFRIYQLDFSEGKSTKPFAFSGIDALRKAGYEQPPAAEYRMVYDGEQFCATVHDETKRLKLISKRYSGDLPKGYPGRSVSPSNVIELYDDETRRYFYCDEDGSFCPVKFSPILAKPLRQN
ncbi:MAG: YodL domain-containing protein [Oscillospiraceae bacterium]|nr:YodL domain-containing protein [Oscillospiraceae bacterium]